MTLAGRTPESRELYEKFVPVAVYHMSYRGLALRTYSKEQGFRCP